MKRWHYYNRVVVCDLVRLWSTVQHHVIIVAGICLPILILLALKRGHVAELRKELLKSPSGREITFWSAQNGEILNSQIIRRLEGELPGVDIIIPEAQRLGKLVLARGGAKPRQVNHVTFFATRLGDPLLRQMGCDVLSVGERGVVLAQAVANLLQANVGDTVQLWVERERAGVSESGCVELIVKALLMTTKDDARIGYLDQQVIDGIERFVQGYRVAEFGWPALKASAREEFSGYLIFCEKTNTLRAGDLRVLQERGYIIEKAKDQDLRLLFGLLKPESLEKVDVFYIYTSASRTDPKQRLSRAPAEIAEMTLADDVVIPWNVPATFDDKGTAYLFVGLSLPTPNWLRSYLHQPEAAFEYGDPEFSVKFPLSAPPELATLTFAISASSKIHLKQIPVTYQTDGGTAVAKTEDRSDKQQAKLALGESPRTIVGVVPASLPAHLQAYRDKTVDFEPAAHLFVPVPADPIYDKARLYANTIDDVPAVVEALRTRQFAFASQNARIREIHNQDASLQSLVAIVGLGVFFFGTITVFSVLLDSTDRKRSTMGILRVMGVSRFGIFYLVFLRASIIGVLAGVVTVACGHAVAWLLGWQPETPWLRSHKPVIMASLSLHDVALIFGGSLLCCLLGSLLPAWRASRIDPFEAIVEGRFR